MVYNIISTEPVGLGYHRVHKFKPKPTGLTHVNPRLFKPSNRKTDSPKPVSKGPHGLVGLGWVSLFCPALVLYVVIDSFLHVVPNSSICG
jgi:hypothetical protein